MELFLSHQSALEYWRIHRLIPSRKAQRRCRAELPCKTLDLSLRSIPELSLPIHVLVADKKARRPSTAFKPHLFRGETPVGCFLFGEGQTIVSSPEFCFLEMADRLTMIELIELGFEICGSYSLPTINDPNPPTRGFYTRPPITSTKKIRVLVDKMTGAKGRQKALRALGFLQDNSASPMETKLMMILILPYRLGGFGFPIPEMNKQITPHKAARRSTSKTYFNCDLFWPDFKLAVEYDSDTYHSGPEQIASDSIRRNTLSMLKVKVITVTNQQLRSTIELRSIAQSIANQMGRRLRVTRNSEFETTHRLLRESLLKP